MSQIADYDVVEKILKEKGITAYQVSLATGLSPSVFSDWKRGKSKPKADKLQIISEFLEVPIETFIKTVTIPLPKFTHEEIAKIALLGGLDSVSDAGWEEIKAYAQFVKSREQINHN